MNERLRTGSRVRILLLGRYTGVCGFFSFGDLVASMPKKPNNFDEYISSGCGRCRLAAPSNAEWYLIEMSCIA
jgi:hypothetical protein